MNTVNTLQSFFLEYKKNRRKPMFLLFLAMIVINCFYLYPNGRQRDYSEWLNVPYYLFLINTILLSVMMSIIASNAMNIEHSGSTWKLLETMQSKKSLYSGKILYGFSLLTAFALFQTAALILWGKYWGWESCLPVRDWVLIAVDQILFGMLIYSMQCIFSLIFQRQFAAISINLIGTFLGFFLLYVSRRVLIPWTMLEAMGFVRMDWNPSTRYVHLYYEFPAPYVYLVSVFYLLAAIALGWFLYSRVEEGALPGIERKHRVSKTARSILPAELMKLKRAPLWIAFFLIPILSAIVGTFNFTQNQGVLSFSWMPLWSQHSLFIGIFFLAPLIGLFASHLWKLEHDGTNWNMLLTVASPAKIVRDKLLILSLVTSLSILWISLLYVISGKIVGLSDPIPSALFEWVLCGILGSIAVCSAQVFLSLVIRNFAIPIGLGLAGSIAGLYFNIKNITYGLPYALLQLGIRANNPERVISLAPFVTASVVWIVLFYFLSVIYLKKADMRTQT